MKATSGDFSRVMQVVKDQICRALKDKHLSMELFKVSLVKQHSIAEVAKSQFAHLGKFSLTFSSPPLVMRVIFSILNHPCSFMVYYYLFGGFPTLN